MERVFFRYLKKEGKVCMDLLQCNIVIVKPSEPKILRLNLKRSPRTSEILAGEAEQQQQLSAPTTVLEVLRVAENMDEQPKKTMVAVSSGIGRGGAMFPRHNKPSTPSSSPDEVMTPFTPSEHGTSSKSSSDTSPCQVSGPLSNNSSTELGVSRDLVSEAAAVELLEKRASFRAFYPEMDDGILIPGLLSPEDVPIATVHKPKHGRSPFDMRAPAEHAKPPSGDNFCLCDLTSSNCLVLNHNSSYNHFLVKCFCWT